MRAIDADKLKEVLEKNFGHTGGASVLAQLINAQDTIHPEPHWIPVTERLPEDDVYVLLTVRRMDDSYNHVPFISTGYISWNHQCWWCAHDGNCKDANIDVLAWMPLPEPYKEVTE